MSSQLLIFITFHSCFLSIIYARVSYLANDPAMKTATYTYIYIYSIPVYEPHYKHPFFLFSSSSWVFHVNLRTQAQTVLRKKLHYIAIFLEIWILRISYVFKRKCCIQITEPTWALETQRKLVNLRDAARRNNLRILGIKKDFRESWKTCENKIYDLLVETLEMSRNNISIEIVHRVEEKLKVKERLK